MAMDNVAILNLLYNYIDKNKQGVGNWLQVPNKTPFPITDPHKIIVV